MNEKGHKGSKKSWNGSETSWKGLDDMEGSWSWSFFMFFSLSFLESSWHESTSKDKEACWNFMEYFGGDGEGLAKVGIIACEGLGYLDLALLKVFATKWRLAWVSLKGSLCG